MTGFTGRHYLIYRIHQSKDDDCAFGCAPVYAVFCIRHQARHAHIPQIGRHLTQPWSLWTPSTEGPAPHISTRKYLIGGILCRTLRHIMRRSTMTSDYRAGRHLEVRCGGGRRLFISWGLVEERWELSCTVRRFCGPRTAQRMEGFMSPRWKDANDLRVENKMAPLNHSELREESDSSSLGVDTSVRIYFIYDINVTCTWKKGVCR